jgi:hypothetical protein
MSRIFIGRGKRKEPPSPGQEPPGETFAERHKSCNIVIPRQVRNDGKRSYSKVSGLRRAKGKREELKAESEKEKKD